jgi:hypothetical protein
MKPLESVDPPADALFQVDDQQPVSLAHLERVNPGLTLEERGAICALRPGKSLILTHEQRTVRVRRTR